MPRQIPSAILAARQSGNSYVRDFVSLWAKNRDTGAVTRVGVWNGLDEVTLPTINPADGQPENRTYFGMGQLVKRQDLLLDGSMTIKQMDLTFTGLNNIFEAGHKFTVEDQPAQLHQGDFYRDGDGPLVAPLQVVMTGVVDNFEVTRGEVVLDSSESRPFIVHITILDQLAELNRVLHLKYSDAHQRLVDSTDTGMEHAANVAGWQSYWGRQARNAPFRR